MKALSKKVKVARSEKSQTGGRKRKVERVKNNSANFRSQQAIKMTGQGRVLILI